jgi:hypothetical protein
MQAMLIPPLPFEAPDGMAILLQQHRKAQYSRAARRRSLLQLNP